MFNLALKLKFNLLTLFNEDKSNFVNFNDSGSIINGNILSLSTGVKYTMTWIDSKQLVNGSSIIMTRAPESTLMGG